MPADSDKQTGKPGRVFLRRARQKARQLGLEFETDQQAVEMLEDLGVDIMNDDVSILDDPDEFAENKGAVAVKRTAGVADPGKVTYTLNDAERLAEVHAIQRELIRRRRLRLGLLFVRLFLFVLLPTILVGRYYYFQATPMYETESEFVIQKSEAQRGGMSLGSLFSGTGFANSADSITVQGYLTSREAMVRLDDEMGYRAHFEQDFIDSIQRLPEDATLTDAYEFYKENVTVGYDPSEGVIHLSVIAATPEKSQQFAEALIRFAEERVDQLSQRVREDQMKGARSAYEDAEKALQDAQDEVLRLQKLYGIVSADTEIASQMAIINKIENQIAQKRIDLASQLDNPTPNAVRVDSLRQEIARLEGQTTELRQAMTAAGTEQNSLAAISAELSIAETNMATRQMIVQQSLEQLELARLEANRQVRYLSIGVAPIAPDVPTSPRKLENTALAFIVFLGLYIFISLTVAILREQVSV